MLYNTQKAYGWLSKFLHWTVGVSILIMLFAGYYMTDMPPSPEKFKFYGIHKAFGVTILILVIIRLIWRTQNVTPQKHPSIPNWQVIAAELNVKILYFLMAVMPLSGIFMSLYGGYPINFFNLFAIPAFEKNIKLSNLAKEFHEAFAVLLIIAVTLHLLASLYHHFIKKDDTLRKML